MKDKASRCIPLSETNAQIKESESNLHVLFFNQRKYSAFYSINNWLVASSFILLGRDRGINILSVTVLQAGIL